MPGEAERELLKKGYTSRRCTMGSQEETKMTATTEAPVASATAYSDWQGATGEGWAANAGHYETMLADVGAALLDHASFAPGEHAPARDPGLVGSPSAAVRPYGGAAASGQASGATRAGAGR